MRQDCSAEELTYKILLALLLDRRRGQTRFGWQELVTHVNAVANSILRSINQTEVWAMRSKDNRRVYLKHSQTGRIICELGIIAKKNTDDSYSIPELALVDRRNLISSNTKLSELVKIAARPRPERKYHGADHRSNRR